MKQVVFLPITLFLCTLKNTFLQTQLTLPE